MNIDFWVILSNLCVSLFVLYA
uniref:Uncharacterized protein n=1 Tax=Rhizophora mucronata TaxID=61149 RepID=A0A2P2Q0J2_RHIMU